MSLFETSQTDCQLPISFKLASNGRTVPFFVFVICSFTLSATAEKKFTLLFDGTTLDGWKQSGNWKIQKDQSVHRVGPGGSLTYTKSKIPDDFELRFEWKVGEGANSGVYYRPGQYEYQILHNQKHGEGKNPRTSAASLYFCMAPSHDATKPAGQWNTGRIVCKGTVIQHWLNGKKVIDFDYTAERWAFNVDLLQKRGANLTSRGGHLSLQDHGDPVWYRKIRLLAISDEESISDKTVTPENIKPEVLEAERKKLKIIRDEIYDKKKKGENVEIMTSNNKG